MSVPHVVGLLLTVFATGLFLGYVVGSSGPCDHDALDAEGPTTARLLHERYTDEETITDGRRG